MLRCFKATLLNLGNMKEVAPTRSIEKRRHRVKAALLLTPLPKDLIHVTLEYCDTDTYLITPSEVYRYDGDLVHCVRVTEIRWLGLDRPRVCWACVGTSSAAVGHINAQGRRATTAMCDQCLLELIVATQGRWSAKPVIHAFEPSQRE